MLTFSLNCECGIIAEVDRILKTFISTVYFYILYVLVCWVELRRKWSSQSELWYDQIQLICLTVNTLPGLGILGISHFKILVRFDYTVLHYLFGECYRISISFNRAKWVSYLYCWWRFLVNFFFLFFWGGLMFDGIWGGGNFIVSRVLTS